MAAKASQLDALADIASLRKAEAERRLKEALEIVTAKRAEVEQLRRYMDDYRERAEAARSPVGSERWLNLRAFIARLADAVRVREQELDGALECHRAAMERWRDSHREAEALAKLAAKRVRAARRRVARLAQAELDERASRRRD